MKNYIYRVDVAAGIDQGTTCFELYDDAKEFADECCEGGAKLYGVEVEYNDYGECVDHSEPELLYDPNSAQPVVDCCDCAEDFKFNINDITGGPCQELCELDLDAPEDPEAGKMGAAAAQICLATGLCESYTKDELDEIERLCKQYGVDTKIDLIKLCGEPRQRHDPLTALRALQHKLGKNFKKIDEGCTKRRVEDYDIEAMVEALGGEDDDFEGTGMSEKDINDMSQDELEAAGAFNNLNEADEETDVDMGEEPIEVEVEEEPVEEPEEAEEAEETNTVISVKDAALSDLLLDEKEAIEGYNDAIDELKDAGELTDNAEETLKHISDEELEHIGELSELVGETEEEPVMEDFIGMPEERTDNQVSSIPEDEKSLQEANDPTMAAEAEDDYKADLLDLGAEEYENEKWDELDWPEVEPSKIHRGYWDDDQIMDIDIPDEYEDDEVPLPEDPGEQEEPFAPTAEDETVLQDLNDPLDIDFPEIESDYED